MWTPVESRMLEKDTGSRNVYTKRLESVSVAAGIIFEGFYREEATP